MGPEDCLSGVLVVKFSPAGGSLAASDGVDGPAEDTALPSLNTPSEFMGDAGGRGDGYLMLSLFSHQDG